ncbi:MAG: MFS transporter [Pyrinomonadaceae bacterium]
MNSATSLEQRAVSRITRRLLPFLILLFIVAFIDRVNVGYAALEMTGDLGFDPEILGFGAGIFFIGYFILEIPGTLIVERWSARKWLARIIVSWGILATMMGFIQDATQFYIVRFLLGLAEAGFFPGVIVYLSHWFPYRHRAKTVAMFMAAIPVANIIGAPISGLILGINWLDVAGWRWVFILEGLPAVVLGFVTLFYLTDKPRQAKWLPEEETDWLEAELAREKLVKHSRQQFTMLQAVSDRRVILLSLVYFCSVTSAYGFSFFLPTIIKELSGFSNLMVSLVAILPYIGGLVAMILVGTSSDRTGERRWHTSLSFLCVSIGLFLSSIAYANGNAVLAVAMFCLVGIGTYSALPAFWSLPTAFLTESAAAACIGMINSIGNLGGFVGPYVVGYLVKNTGSFSAGILYLSCSAMAAAVLVLLIKKLPMTERFAATDQT